MSCKQSEAELKQTGGICLMNEELRYKDTVKEAIAIALVDLMGTRPLDQISVKDIVLRAGVGRSSFYRNFGRREDILLLCIDHMLQLPPKAAPYSNENVRDSLIIHFQIVKRNRDFFTLLRRQNLLHLLYQQTCLDVKRSIKDYGLYRNPYQAAFFSGAGASVLIQWIENGFRESESEMADMFIYLMDGHHREKD